MTTAIRIEVLPARLGDCLLVECVRDTGRPWRMLVDGGPPDTWPILEQRLKRLRPDEQYIDVAVVTHIDSDHIGGMIPFLQSEYAHHVGDYWFNGRTHLPGMTSKRSVGQGESVVAALLGESGGRVLPWNLSFGGGPIDTGDAAGFIEVPIRDGPHITVLSPTTKRLEILAAKWSEAMDQAKRGRVVETRPDIREPLDDLVAIAVQKSPKDSSAPNGSSIALLVEHRGASVVLGADAFGNVLGAGLKGVAAARDQKELPVDAFKLPHHASKSNVFEAMLKAVPAQHYLVSTNGDTFHHPDDAALARVVLTAPPGPTLWFNYHTERIARWADPALCERYLYTARFPEAPEAGAVLELPGGS
ncbi:MBL fold metallo-hydrolase [Streptomyces sp. NBC_00133]|uniref:MBL fold metallo-hydrolase n=1 Tax=Streptomyces sp. NBC_00133 TaxID=2903624 RepID=UPI0032484786